MPYVSKRAREMVEIIKIVNGISLEHHLDPETYL